MSDFGAMNVLGKEALWTKKIRVEKINKKSRLDTYHPPR